MGLQALKRWLRSRLGGTLVDANLCVVEPATGELALVQVQSQAGQAVLDDDLARSDANACARMCFLCLTSEGRLKAAGRGDIHVWSSARRPRL